jgi:tetratricopeptide (TPR) repeat protein
LLPLLLALAARAAYWLLYVRSPLFEIYRVDQTYYRTWGLRIAAGDLLGTRVFEQGPLYAYLLGGWYALFGAGEGPLLAVQLATGLATVSLTFWCAGRLGGRRAALIAGVLAALYGPLIFYECMVMKTFLEPLLVLAALAAAVRALDGRGAFWFAVSGAALGAACLVREAHALLLVPLLLLAARGPAPAAGAGRRGALALALAAGFAFALSPATVRNWVVARELVAVSAAGGENFYLGFGPYATGAYAMPDFVSGLPYREHEEFREEAQLLSGRRLTAGESSRYWLGEALRAIGADPARALRLVGAKALLLFADREAPDSENYAVTRGFVPLLRLLPSFGWVAGPGLLGVWLLLRRRGAAALPGWFAAGLILEVLLTFNLGRYRAGLAAVLLLCAGVGLSWLVEVLGTPGRTGRGVWIAVAVFAASAATFIPPSGDAAAWFARVDDAFRREVVAASASRPKIAALERMRAARPADPALSYALGEGLERTGRLYEAEGAFRQVVRVEPAADGSRWELATIRMLYGDLEQAAEQARVLVTRDPSDAARHVLLGTVLGRQAMRSAKAQTAARLLQEALEHLQRAVVLRPRDAPAHYQLARLLEVAGDAPAALREVSRALELRPDYPEARYLRGVLQSPAH